MVEDELNVKWGVQQEAEMRETKPCYRLSVLSMYHLHCSGKECGERREKKKKNASDKRKGCGEEKGKKKDILVNKLNKLKDKR